MEIIFGVLVNGKRRHQQALVNVQQTIGRGSAGTDINAIPLSPIHHIEVLRDGAAAQYGSDAIAGVINIVLKSQTNETQLSGTLGTTSKHDGDLYSGSAHTGFALGAGGGFLNLTLEGRHRGETNRAETGEFYAFGGVPSAPAIRPASSARKKTRAPCRPWNLNSRARYYGEVQGRGFTAPFIQTW